MKKLTLISIGITVLGLFLALISAYLNIKSLSDIGIFFMFGGFILIYFFLAAWQAQVSRTRLFFVLSIYGFIISTFIIFSYIKASEAEKNLYVCEQISYELTNQVKEANDEIKSLENQIKKCE